METNYFRQRIRNQTEAEYRAAIAEDYMESQQILQFLCEQIPNKYALAQACKDYLEQFTNKDSD